MRRAVAVLVHCAAAAALVAHPSPVRRAAMTARARPEECPPEVWERIVEAEANSREKKFGAVGAALSNFGLDKGSIEENQLRIWEELKAKQASGAKPRKRTEAEAAPAPGPFAGLKKAWDDAYKEADAQGYAQAVALNAKLEEKGILSKAPRREKLSAETDLRGEPLQRKPSKKKNKKKKGAKPSANQGDGFGR